MIVLALSFLVLGTAFAVAHAYLDRAEPRVGNSVRTAPRELSLWFTQNLEAAFSTVEVTDGSGARVDQGKAQVNGDNMRIGLKPLKPGAYRVHWRVLSVDTHVTEGNFSFRVGE